jgi:eukaryotic-like serine/threonine-protein kinase
VADSGTLVYARGGVLEDKRSLLWIDRHGKEQPVVATKRPYSSPQLSPDGRTIAITLETSTFDIWQLDVERDTMTRVSFGGDDSRSVWTPDGRRIIWSSTRGGHDNLYWAAADNSGGEERLTNSEKDQFATEVSPDGKFVAVTDETSPVGVELVALAGDHKATPFFASPRFNEHSVSFSPDGKWIAYVSDESGRPEAYLRPFPQPGGKWQISTAGATDCKWTRNAHEITFLNGTRLYSVSIETEPAVRIGKPQLIYEDPTHAGPWKIWDFSLDNQRILWVKSEAEPTAAELQITLNWFDELKRRAPRR